MSYTLYGSTLALAFNADAQQPFDLDTTFRTHFNTWYVSSALLMDDGDIVVSGQLRVGDEFFFRTGAKLHQDGSFNTDFTTYPAMGGKLSRWQERIYAANGPGLRRLYLDGSIDEDFQMATAPYFDALQGGDYHVYPDGRILMSGAHELDDPVRGFVGLYNLIWFTNTGHLDTTRTHRKGDGVIYEIEETPDGKFLCTGTCTVYEGQPVGGIFRVHADGTLDTTYTTDVFWGEPFSFLPLADGRHYAGGIFRKASAPQDTLRLTRFLSNGELDPTFNNHIPFSRGSLPNPGFGATIGTVQPWTDGSMLVMGTFQFVNGEPRRGICVIDSTGQLLPEFDGCGVGPYTYQNFTYASIRGYQETPDNMAYIWGAYHGYNDGTTNDTLQRFVSRLYGPDFHTVVQEATEESPVKLYPNPTHGQVTITRGGAAAFTSVLLRDGTGRVVLEQGITSMTEVRMELGHLASGWYLVELMRDGERTGVEKLMLQP